MVDTVRYTGKNSDNGPSPIIWADCPWLEAINDPNVGYGWWDDFLAAMALPTTAEVHGGYLQLDTGDSTLTATAKVGGEIAILTTTDNEDAGIQLGSGAPFVIAAAAADGKKLWFEARYKKSAIAQALGGMFVGLASEAALAANFIADAGADFSDVDLIGFWNDETDDSVGSHVHTVTQKTGAAFDTIEDTFDTLVADTYVKHGFIYDPDAAGAKRIRFFADGVESATTVGQASGDATVYCADTTNFPGGEEMSMIAYQSSASAADLVLTMDWWRCFQMR